MKHFRVIYTTDVRGTNVEKAIIYAERFDVVAEKYSKCIMFFTANEKVGMFTADKIVAIYEV